MQCKAFENIVCISANFKFPNKTLYYAILYYMAISLPKVTLNTCIWNDISILIVSFSTKYNF